MVSPTLAKKLADTVASLAETGAQVGKELLYEQLTGQKYPESVPGPSSQSANLPPRANQRPAEANPEQPSTPKESEGQTGKY